MLASVATHTSRSKISPAALLEHKTGEFVPILKRLRTQAQKAYRDANAGVVNTPNDIFKPSRPYEASTNYPYSLADPHR